MEMYVWHNPCVYKNMICSGRGKEHIRLSIENMAARTAGLFKKLFRGKSPLRREEEFVGYEVFPFKYLTPRQKGKEK